MAADKAVELYLEQDKRMVATAAPATQQCVYAVCVCVAVCVRCVYSGCIPLGIYRSTVQAAQSQIDRAYISINHAYRRDFFILTSFWSERESSLQICVLSFMFFFVQCSAHHPSLQPIGFNCGFS